MRAAETRNKYHEPAEAMADATEGEVDEMHRAWAEDARALRTP